MFEFIGFLFLLLVCYVFIQMVAVRVFPEYGVRKANDTVEIHQQKMRICYGELEVV
jgi:hypothetical protein